MCRRAHRMSSASGTQPRTAARGGPSAAAVLQVRMEATRRCRAALKLTKYCSSSPADAGDDRRRSGGAGASRRRPPAADDQARCRERRQPAPVTECDSVLGPTSRGSPTMNCEQRGQMRRHLCAYLPVRMAMGGGLPGRGCARTTALNVSHPQTDPATANRSFAHSRARMNRSTV
jgi:hypothetical protein